MPINGHLSDTIHINCSFARCLIKLSISRHVPLSGHDDGCNFLDDTAVQKNDHYVIIASLKSESLGELINRIPGPGITTHP